MAGEKKLRQLSRGSARVGFGDLQMPQNRRLSHILSLFLFSFTFPIQLRVQLSFSIAITIN